MLVHESRRRGVALAVALTLLIAAVASAAPGRGRSSRARVIPIFNVAGTFTGTLAGEIYMGESFYRLAPDVVLYELGSGPLPAGTVVVDRRISISGIQRGSTGLVTSVIVLPAPAAVESNQRPCGERPSDDPR